MTCTPWKYLQTFIKIQYDIRGWKISQRKGLKIFMKIQYDICSLRFPKNTDVHTIKWLVSISWKFFSVFEFCADERKTLSMVRTILRSNHSEIRTKIVGSGINEILSVNPETGTETLIMCSYCMNKEMKKFMRKKCLEKDRDFWDFRDFGDYWKVWVWRKNL